MSRWRCFQVSCQGQSRWNSMARTPWPPRPPLCGLVVTDDPLAAPAQGVRAGQVQRRVLPHLEQVGDQAEHLRGLLAAVSCRGVHGVLDDADGDRGPSFFRGGFSSARYLPSARTRTGLRVNDAEARHRRRAPAARKARAAAQDKNLRSASTSMPGPKQPSRSAASGCPASVYRPIAAPRRSRPARPQSAGLRLPLPRAWSAGPARWCQPGP
jgi:Tfp pilus assembly protein FimV